MKIDRPKNILRAMALLSLVPLAHVRAEPAPAARYHESKRIFFGGEGGWDYLIADSNARRLYIARNNRVMVIDLDREKLIGEVKGLDGAHGVALAKNLNRGFATSGKSGEVFVFDLKTLAITQKIKVGENPDAVIYEPFSQSVFAFNGKSKTVSMIDSKNLTVVATLPLDGKPEFAASNAKGKVFVAIEDKNEIQAIDVNSKKVLATYPLETCKDPSGLAIDLQSEQLILGCGNKIAVIVNASTGKVMQSFAVGDGVDAAAFDSKQRLAFISAGEGKLSVFSLNTHHEFQTPIEVKTDLGARTMAVDEKTGNVFLPVAKFEKAVAGQKRRSVVADTFSLIKMSP